MNSACVIEDPAALRAPGQAMRLARLGSHHASRLSFARVLLRDLVAADALIDRPHHALDEHGYGSVVYRVRAGDECYSLCCFSTPLAPEQRTDRVIAQAWDASFVLFDGEPDAAQLARLQANAPLQEAGRFAATDLVLSRANRSVRLFDHVVQSLAQGDQPDVGFVRDVGYLMRTTAVYGNGKFGLADRSRIAARRLLRGAFRPEMLSVYLIRLFTHELVEHIAAVRAPGRAVGLSASARRALGIGNATGLGMAPFIVTHAQLFNNWMLARETALARVRTQPRADGCARRHFETVLARVGAYLDQWQVDDARQHERLNILRDELAGFRRALPAAWASDRPWDAIYACGQGASLELQELLVSLLLEPHGALVDGLADCCDADETVGIDARGDCGSLLEQLRAQARWALDIDMNTAQAQALFWYVSEEKLEPRLGRRDSEPGCEREMPLAIVRDYQALEAELARAPAQMPLAAWLAAHPEHRHVVMRLQSLRAYPYAEIHDNLIAGDCLPIDLLRCKLAMFGASRFDPKSDRWTRISLFHGAPSPSELRATEADDWSFAVVPAQFEASDPLPVPSIEASQGTALRRPRSGQAGAVDLSVGEFVQLVRKAAIGAGLEIGLAHELANAAGLLATVQADSIGDAVLAALGEPGTDPAPMRHEDGPWIMTAAPAVRLIPAVLDLALAATEAPGVILPGGISVAWLAAYIGTRPLVGQWRLELRGIEDPSQVLDPADCLRGANPPGAGGLLLRALAGEAPGCPPPAGRVMIARSSLADLQRWALETTVPSSESSRTQGAGAAIDDNL
ncbi:MAG: hypothetical protein R3E83_07565 [Burkholderiaceae bacterium]